MDRPLLQIESLRVGLRTAAGPRCAVEDVSFALHQGETLAIVGERGSGKRLLYLAMLRLPCVPPAEVLQGRALFKGQDLLAIKPHELARVRGGEIACLFRDPMTSLNPTMPIERQIAETMEKHLHIARGESRRRTIALLERVGIPNPSQCAQQYPHQFSAGARQRILLALAVSCRPKLLIADEPTAHLDATIGAQIIALIQAFQQEMGMAVLWVTRDLALTTRVARRMLLLYAGQIVESGTMASILGEPAHPYTIGLLSSLPRLDELSPHKLRSIEGDLPPLTKPPSGCPFWPRCPHHTAICTQERPGLLYLGEGRRAACWHVDTIRQRVQAWG
mgnify:CR=1